MTPSERFVYEISKGACLSLWTYANPIGKHPGKELCDVLVVCQPDVIILSVKEVQLKKDGDPAVQVERWQRRAIEASVKQVYGAQRHLASIDSVTASGGGAGVQLGARDERVVHRIAVAIGSGGSLPLRSDDFGKGFVHVFDEQTIFLLLSELDTVTDFVQYLSAREALLQIESGQKIIATEDDLLAVYAINGGSFATLLDDKFDLKILLGIWGDYSKSDDYAARKRADEPSYIWDRLIAQVHDDYADGEMEFGEDLASVDAITRAMARETRLNRRMLGEAFRAFMNDTETESRMILNRNGKTHYVYLKQSHAIDRKYRTAELAMRCYITRDKMDKEGLAGTIIGLATEIREEGSGFSLDCLLLDLPVWEDEQRAEVRRLQEEFGFFTKPRIKNYKG